MQNRALTELLSLRVLPPTLADLFPQPDQGRSVLNVSIWQYLLTAFWLGLAAFDPAPALIAIAALAAKASRRDVGVFAIALIAGTAIWGIVLSAFTGKGLTKVDWHTVLREGPVPAGIEIIVGIALAVYSAIRFIKSRREVPDDDQDPDSDTEHKGLPGLLLTAGIFVAIVIADPPFPVFTALSASQPFAATIAGWIIWAAVSQLCLTIVLCCLPFGLVTAVASFLDRLLTRATPIMKKLFTVFLLVAAVLCLVDALAFFLTGSYVIG